MVFKKRKGAIELSFGWLFAIIAGIVIIFLALYLSSKLIGTQQQTVNAETGKEIGILLNPLETSFESAQTTSMTIPVESKIEDKCDTKGNFGNQIIQVEQKSFGKWTQTDVNIKFENKYIFLDNQTEGKKFYIFSKPFYFPFKVADLIYISSSNQVYCFVDAPSNIKEEISNLNQANLLTENCSEGNIKVCFERDNCEVNVNYQQGFLEKNKTMYYFSGIGEDYKTLMYAAIFSDKAVYECQIKRLMMRTGEIALIYSEKESLTKKAGCDENLGTDMNIMNGLTSGLNNSEEIGVIGAQADNINAKNNGRMCLLW
ncbi:Uncharacterised protein [uncultured archaeon]|nr:Uncharacterised protein [uncultured archaeon]